MSAAFKPVCSAQREGLVLSALRRIPEARP
jgi:hypothetical protein